MGLVAKLAGWLAPPTPSDAERDAIEQAVDCVDPRLRLLPGYQRKLAPVARTALAYCDGLVAAIPGPIDINVHAFGADPLVHALFGAPGDIGRMLATSRAVREFVADPANDAEEFFAMIGMRRKVKTVAGLEMHGDLIQEGAPRRLLYFADHTLYDPNSDVEMARRGLRVAAFESLAKSFAAHLADLRRGRDDLRIAWDQQRARARNSRRDADGVQAQQLLGLEQALREAARELEPARVLEAFRAWLTAPQPRLHLEETSLSVDRLGVIVDADNDDADVTTLTLPELIGRDRRRWIVLLTRISRTDALRAQHERAESNRYLMI